VQRGEPFGLRYAGGTVIEAVVKINRSSLLLRQQLRDPVAQRVVGNS